MFFHSQDDLRFFHRAVPHGKSGGVRLALIFRRLGIFHSFSAMPPHQVECDDSSPTNVKVQAVFDREGKLNAEKSWKISRGGKKVGITVQ